MRLTGILAAAAVGAAVLTGCGNDDDERYAEVACVDRVTQVRVADWRCNNNDPNFLPWYLTAGQSMFGYGQRAPYGSVAPPQGYRTRTITATPPPSATTAPASTSAPKATTSAKPQTTEAKPQTTAAKPKPASPAPKPPVAKPPAKPKPAR